MKSWHLPLGLSLWFALLHAAAAAPAAAGELRDPTRPPAALEADAPESPDALPISTEGLSVVVRDGQPLLVVGTRLYGVGQQVGSYRLERITETEVWLRDGRGLRKLPRFAGIQRSVVRDACARPAAQADAAKPGSGKTGAGKTAAGTATAVKNAPAKPPAREARAAKAQAGTTPPESATNALPPCEPSPP